MASKRPAEFDILRANTAYDAVMHAWRPIFKNPDVAEGFFPIVINGGIGDLIIAIPAIHEVQRHVGAIRVFTNYPEVFDFAWRGERAQVERYMPETGFDHWLSIETIPRFFTLKNFLGFKNPNVERLYAQWSDFCRNHPELKKFMDTQPNFDHEIGVKSVEMKLTRNDLPGLALGLSVGLPKIDHPLDAAIDLGSYITVHDGFDATQVDIPYRSTKSWSLKHWSIFTREFKKWNKDIAIVQLGASKNSRPIPNIDHDLRGIYSIRQSLNLLRGSKLHIDGDSGLVHAAHAMGVRSVVIFGSTPAEFFGYPDNINLSPKVCGGCWWLTRSWMRRCPLHSTPKCIDSVDPILVLESVNRAIAPKEE